jgi:hypothetical protein
VEVQVEDKSTARGVQECNGLRPDTEAARAFLEAFDGNHCFQTFEDRGQDRRLARTICGRFDAIAAQLLELNQKGAGIFFTVNEIGNASSRKADNIIRIRALFADSDDPSQLPEVEDRILKFGISPSIVVESSPGKRHFYFLTDSVCIEKFTTAQKALATALGTDPAVCDLPRVMRLPGFIQRKGAPFVTKVLHIT